MNIFWYALLLSLGIQIFFFLFAYFWKTDKLTDLSYGLTFIIIAWVLFLTKSVYSLIQLVLVLAVTLWGLRLITYLLIRIIKMGRDKRFDGIRENFNKFFQFWFFQGLSVWIIMLPVILVLNKKSNEGLTIVMGLGLVIWAIGLIIETIADKQKFQFKNKAENKGKFIESGIWKYSRHPNYFGEMMCWWGLFILITPVLTGWEWFTVTGPVFITFILLYVSGIPPLEKRYKEIYKNNPDFKRYKKTTNLLIPWFPKKI